MQAVGYLAGLDAIADETQPDAILYTPHYSSCARQAAAVARRLRIPFVLVLAVHLDHPLHTSRAAQRFFQSVALVCCLSDIEHAWLVRRAGVSPERILTMACGWSGRPERQAARMPDGSIRLFTVGVYVGHKQLDHQIEALARLRHVFHVNARLTVVGAPLEPSVLNRLRQLSRRHEVDDSVEFLTDVTDSGLLARLYRDSDRFLFTSRSESFGLALLDAIAYGTLPIVYPHPVYRTLVESSGFGVVTRHASPGALADAVRCAVAEPPSRSDHERLRWLRERSWPRVTAPLARAMERLHLFESA